jgi:predicted DNA-binding transcriptional regulator AlpA
MQMPENNQQPRRLLSLKQLASKLEVSERTAQKIVTQPWMPSPVQLLLPRIRRWIEDEVDAAVSNRAPRQDGPGEEPPQLARRRSKREGAAA